MKTRAWSEEHIIRLLQLAEKGESTIAVLCRTHGVAENTFYKWRQKYGGLQVISKAALSYLTGCLADEM